MTWSMSNGRHGENKVPDIKNDPKIKIIPLGKEETRRMWFLKIASVSLGYTVRPCFKKNEKKVAFLFLFLISWTW